MITGARYGVNGGSAIGVNQPRLPLHFGQAKDFTFTFSATEKLRYFSGGTNQPGITVQDRVVNRITMASTVSDFDIVVTPSPLNRKSETITVTSGNTGRLANPASGTCAWVADGAVTLTAASASASQALAVTARTVGGQTVDTFVSWVIGSMALHIINTVDSRLAGKLASTALNLFSSRSDGNSIYVRNTDLWASDIDWTSASVWNSDGGVNKAGTLISPRHILFAKHYQIGPGATIRYVKSDNTVVTKTVSAVKSVDTNDFTIGILDSDVSGVSFAKVLPDNWALKIPNSKGLPVQGFNQFKQLNVLDVFTLSGFNLYTRPTDSQRLAFFNDIITGDSGSPVYMIINSSPVLLTTWTSGGGGTGVVDSKTLINAAMHSLSVAASAGSDYQLTEIDLSGFPSY